MITTKKNISKKKYRSKNENSFIAYVCSETIERGKTKNRGK